MVLVYCHDSRFFWQLTVFKMFRRSLFQWLSRDDSIVTSFLLQTFLSEELFKNTLLTLLALTRIIFGQFTITKNQFLILHLQIIQTHLSDLLLPLIKFYLFNSIVQLVDIIQILFENLPNNPRTNFMLLPDDDPIHGLLRSDVHELLIVHP